jgi:hypothetical protein
MNARARSGRSFGKERDLGRDHVLTKIGGEKKEEQNKLNGKRPERRQKGDGAALTHASFQAAPAPLLRTHGQGIKKLTTRASEGGHVLTVC